MKNALIIHGTDGHPKENWFPWLKEQLEILEYQVMVPQFPTPENQDPKHWFEVLNQYQDNFNEETVLIGHSCGGAFLLRVLEEIQVKIKAAVFVSASAVVKPIKYYEIDRPFIEEPFDWKKIKNSIENIFVFHSEDDPLICPENAKLIAEKTDADLTILSNAGHFDLKAGYDTFELLLDKLKNI